MKQRSQMRETHSHRHLSALSSRSNFRAGADTRSPLRDLNTDLKESVDPSMQSGELLVDMMKLQNIFNFNLYNMLKQQLPDHVLVQDGKSPSALNDNTSSLIETKRDNTHSKADVQVIQMNATNIQIASSSRANR